MGYGIRKKFRRKYRFSRTRKLYTRRIRRVAKRTFINLSETKFKIDNVNQVINATTGIEKIFGNDITVGTGNDQRIGNQIRVMRVGFDLNCIYNQGNSTIPAAFLRVIMAMPRKGISSSDLTARFTTTDPDVPGRLDPDQALTLYDRRVLVHAVGANTGTSTYRFKFYKYMKMMPANYEDTTGNIDHMPVMYIVTDQGGITTAGVTISGTFSISYKDA
ncbi:MAG: capsid protein [Wigfec virus K19_654]|nr:MAG: capsid protein [Wigfec virus K19_654]